MSKENIGPHIIRIDGRLAFQSDKYPELPPNHVRLSFRDLAARQALRMFILWTDDRELAEDIEAVLDDIDAKEPV